MDSLAKNLIEGKGIEYIKYSNNSLAKFTSLKGIGYAITGIFTLVVLGTALQGIVYNNRDRKEYF